jgi:broad specificity phosphatase PhoE
VWDQEHRIQAWEDVGLSPEGRQDALGACLHPAGLEAGLVMSSPLLRAWEAAVGVFGRTNRLVT